MENKDSIRITIRKANLRDREVILKIASHTWGGWDYVPLLLDGWLKEGGLFIAEVRGRCVGVTKTAVLSPGELWLEGLRVAEEFRNRGIGKRLARFQLKKALSQKPNSIRLSTAEVNTVSIRIIEELGFRLLSTFTYLEAQVREPKRFPHLKPLRSPGRAWRLVEESEFLRYSKGLLPSSWVFYQARERMVADLSSAGMILGEAGGMAILQPQRYDPKNSSEITFFSASEREVLKLLEGINSSAFQRGFKELSVFLPEDFWVQGFTEWGFKPNLGFKYVFVYEYPLRI